MRTHRKLQSIVAIAAGATALAAGTISLTANGATIQTRLTDTTGSIITGDNPAPVQQITGDCGATCVLTAEAGTAQPLYLGLPLNVWSFRTPTGSVSLPGPTIVVNQGDEVSIAVTNSLPAGAGELKLDLPSVPIIDVHTSPVIAANTIAAPNPTGTVTFTASRVGTSIYRASASTPQGNLQVAMGLSGVLIVRPTTCPPLPVGGCAYGGTTDFDDEALLATNDLDPNLASAIDPLQFDMTGFHPTYHLINGKAYPDTEVIDTQPGHQVLIRYANLGLSDHSMALSGTRQQIVGRDSNPLAHGSSDVVVPLNVGQTVDAIVTVPTDAKATYRYALSDQMMQPGANSAAPAMTFLTVWQPSGFSTTETLTFAGSSPLTALTLTTTNLTPNPAVGGFDYDYTLTVTNPGLLATSYTLTSQFAVAPTTLDVVSSQIPNPAYDGVLDARLAIDEPILAGGVHVYQVLATSADGTDAVNALTGPALTVAQSNVLPTTGVGGQVSFTYDLTVTSTSTTGPVSYDLSEAISLTPGMITDSVAVNAIGLGALAEFGFDGGPVQSLVSNATISIEPHVYSITAVGHFAAVAGPTPEINTITPAESAGNVALTFAGTFTLPSGITSATGGTFSIDVPGKPLTSLLSNALDPLGALDLSGVGTLTGTVPVGELDYLTNGTHILWVQLTSGTTFGDPTGIAFTIDRAGPVVRPVELNPAYTNGTVDVSVTATADASLTGNDQVFAGNATMDSCPNYLSQPVVGAGNYPLVVNLPQAIAELSGTIPAADIGSALTPVLTEGTHIVNVSAGDTRGVWSNDGATLPALPAGVCSPAELIVDRTDPDTLSGSTDPSGPNDGTLAYNGVQNFLEVVRIFATVTDATAGVAKVEGFIDTVGLEGSGFLFAPVDGTFGGPGPNEDVYAEIPLASVRTLTPGLHGIYIRAQDKAGNWDQTVTAPTSLNIVSPLPQVGTMFYEPVLSELTVTGNAFGIGVTVLGFEYSTGLSAAAEGLGTAIAVIPGSQVATATIAIPAVAPTDILWVRVQDSLLRWSPAVGLPTTTTPVLVGAGPYRRFTGTATSHSSAGVAAVQYSTSGAPGVWLNIPIGTLVGSASVNYNGGRTIIQPAFVSGTVILVRVQDVLGFYGQAVSVTVP